MAVPWKDVVVPSSSRTTIIPTWSDGLDLLGENSQALSTLRTEGAPCQGRSHATRARNEAEKALRRASFLF
jgi:hypothetical protein